MANSKDILLSCYDGKILALVDSKKFRKDGIMAPENPVQAGDELTEAQAKGQEKEKKQKISSLEKEVAALESQLKALENECR